MSRCRSKCAFVGGWSGRGGRGGGKGGRQSHPRGACGPLPASCCCTQCPHACGPSAGSGRAAEGCGKGGRARRARGATSGNWAGTPRGCAQGCRGNAAATQCACHVLPSAMRAALGLGEAVGTCLRLHFDELPLQSRRYGCRLASGRGAACAARGPGQQLTRQASAASCARAATGRARVASRGREHRAHAQLGSGLSGRRAAGGGGRAAAARTTRQQSAVHGGAVARAQATVKVMAGPGSEREQVSKRRGAVFFLGSERAAGSTCCICLLPSRKLGMQGHRAAARTRSRAAPIAGAGRQGARIAIAGRGEAAAHQRAHYVAATAPRAPVRGTCSLALPSSPTDACDTGGWAGITQLVWSSSSGASCQLSRRSCVASAARRPVLSNPRPNARHPGAQRW